MSVFTIVILIATVVSGVIVFALNSSRKQQKQEAK